jgi:hypothetical protein
MSSSASEAEEDNTPEDEQLREMFGGEQKTKRKPNKKQQQPRSQRGRGRGRGGRGRGCNASYRYQPYERPASVQEEDDAQDAAARREEEAMNAAMNAGAGGDGDEEVAPRVLDEMEIKQQSMISDLERKMYLDADIDWERVLEEDKKEAELKADELGLAPDSPERDDFMLYDEKSSDRCISCRNQGKMRHNDPFNDLNAFMTDNYTPHLMLYCITEVRDLYLAQFMPVRKRDPNMKFWYRKVIYNHLVHHRPLPLTQIENDLHKVDVSLQMAMHSQIRKDEFTGQKYWDSKVAAGMAKLHELKIKLQAEVEKMRKSRRTYF